MTNIGYPSKKPCQVCGAHEENQEEASRFHYTVCKTHRLVPPAFLDAAKKQYKIRGQTDWDTYSD